MIKITPRTEWEDLPEYGIISRWWISRLQWAVRVLYGEILRDENGQKIYHLDVAKMISEGLLPKIEDSGLTNRELREG